MRLHLDDERRTPAGWRCAYTAAETIAMLTAGGVAEIGLDHDLAPPDRWWSR